MNFPKNLPAAPVAIIVAAVIAIIFFVHSSKTIDTDIESAKAEKDILDKQLDRYADIDRYYGRASASFYTDKPIIVMRGSGATELVRIYRSNKSFLTVSWSSDNRFKTDWGDDDKVWANCTITSKISNGYEIFTFKNNDSNEEFRILAIVK